MIPRLAPGEVERVRLRRTSRTFGFAEVRLPAVNISGIQVREEADGRLSMQAPEGLFLQPIWREAILHEISMLWAAS